VSASTGTGAVDSDAIWADAALATELFAVDTLGLGGIVVRSAHGPERDRVCARVKKLLVASAPFLRVPLHITEDRLLGGLSLAATLREGHVVTERGLLALANGGVVTVAMAERLDPKVTSSLCAALDRGEIALERDGITANISCALGVIALDEGIDDERAPAAIRDRLAFHVDLNGVDPREISDLDPDAARVANARARLSRVTVGENIVATLSEVAAALGIDSLRAVVLAAAAARANAALEERSDVDENDAAIAARLVLGPRATRVPVAAQDESIPADDEEGSDENAVGPQDENLADPNDEKRNPAENKPLDELVLEAAKSGIPAGLLDALSLGVEARTAPQSAGRSGVARVSTAGGRPAGTRPGIPQPGERLNVVETLRAAAPWQVLRRRARTKKKSRQKIEIRKEDFRVTSFQQRSETRVIFAVDASGSAAMQRLAEAKGAVEQVLADCYIRRDHVALIAFRGTQATLILPPTRSLARVRRSLSELAGGGATPLSSGIDAALALALDGRKHGQTPVLVIMTDGRANIAKDGKQGNAAATADAIASARAVRVAGVRALFLDTAPRPRPQARALATEMGARYLPLPYLDSVGISRQIRALSDGDA
jgi:magnesium chelatase subunit D